MIGLSMQQMFSLISSHASKSLAVITEYQNLLTNQYYIQAAITERL